jgi:cytochrome d ubiquinol oxidase subunit I
MAVSKFFHTVLSAWVLGGAFVVGVCSWMMLRKCNIDHCHRSLKVGGWVGLIGIVLTIVTGDSSAVTVAKEQPMKLAAMEGLYEGHNAQEIVAFGILNPAKTVDNNEDPYLLNISIPYGLSILANHAPNSFVPGINDIINGISKDEKGNIINTVSYAERIKRGKLAQEAVALHHTAMQTNDAATLDEINKTLDENFKYFGYGYLDSPQEAVPNVPLTFYTFHFMVTVGGYLLLFMALVLFFEYKKKINDKAKWNKWWHWLAIITIPLTYLCSASGWIVAEVGRQPWTIQDLMPNKVAISDLSAGYVQTTFWIFAVVFTALLIADVSIICKQIAKKSKTDLNVAEF